MAKARRSPSRSSKKSRGILWLIAGLLLGAALVGEAPVLGQRHRELRLHEGAGLCVGHGRHAPLVVERRVVLRHLRRRARDVGQGEQFVAVAHQLAQGVGRPELKPVREAPVEPGEQRVILRPADGCVEDA